MIIFKYALEAFKKVFKFVSYSLGTLFFLTVLGLSVRIEEKQETPPDSILVMDLSEPVYETRPNDFISSMTFGDAPTFNDIVKAVRAAAADTHVTALYAAVGDTNLSTAQIQELRAAVADFRKSGKKAYAYASSFGQMEGGLRAYYLATAFDEIWLQPTGELGIAGIGTEAVFFKETLKKAGIKAEFSTRHEYKTGAASFIEEKMSPFERENMQSLLNDLLDTVAADIGAARGFSAEQARAKLLNGPYFAEDALKEKLIDAADYADKLEEKIKLTPDNGADIYEYAAALPEPSASDAVIAYVPLSGVISDGTSFFGGDVYSSVIGVQDAAQMLRDAAADETVKGIVLRLDSPGGGYLPSDALWREIVRIRETSKKPVVCSMGSTAASGGYFLSLACDKVFVLPATITGSVGVFGGKFNAGELLAKLGVKTEEISLGKNNGFFALHRPMTPSQKQFFEASLDRVYKDFTEKTAARRGLSAQQTDAVARGRVFTGVQAVKNNLADALGGVEEARLAASTLAGEKDPLPLVEYPVAPTRWELLAEFVTTGTVQSRAAAFRATVFLRQALAALSVMRADNRLLFMP